VSNFIADGQEKVFKTSDQWVEVFLYLPGRIRSSNGQVFVYSAEL
jgi:hypothetical protein